MFARIVNGLSAVTVPGERLSEENINLDCMTLRFTVAGTEVAFITSQGQDLASRLFHVSSVTAGCIAVSLAIAALRFEEFRDSVFQMRLALLGIELIACLACCLATRGAAFRTKMSGLSREVITIAWAILTMAVVAIALPHYLARFTAQISGTSVDMVAPNYDDEEQSDSGVLLSLIAIIIAVHVCLPVRWLSGVVIDVVGPSMYCALATLLGSPETPRQVPFNVALFFLIGVTLALGMRKQEFKARQLFLHALREKHLRVHSEHELSQATAKAHKAEDIRSESAATTGTDRVFNARDSPMTGIAEIGHREHWLIPEQHLELTSPPQILGSGGFGTVLAGSLHGTPVAVKVAKTSEVAAHLRADAAHVAALCNELRVMRYLRHPNLLLFHGAVVNDARSELMLLLELIEGPSLRTFIEQRLRELPAVDKRLQVLMGVCRALRYLHSLEPHLVHGDLTPLNVMVEFLQFKVRPKLVDFGLSRVLTAKAQQLGGTLFWMAPELIRDEGETRPGPEVDVFSFGCLSYFVASGLVPLGNVSKSAIVQAAKSRVSLPLSWNEADGEFVRACRKLIEKCLRNEGDERPDMASVCAELPRAPLSSFDCVVTVSIWDFFSDQAGDTFMLDAEDCIVLSCGPRILQHGIRPSDMITHIDGQEVGGSNHFRQIVCAIYDEALPTAGRNQDAAIQLTLHRKQAPGSSSAFSTVAADVALGEAGDWHSVASASALRPQVWGLPESAWHQAKTEFACGLFGPDEAAIEAL